MAPLRVVLVDDSPTFRSIARVVLCDAASEVVGEATSVAEAGPAVRRLRPDVVVLDIGLPDGDGIDLARELARDPEAAPTVLVSGRPASDYGSRLPCAAARGFIPKDELSLQRVRELLL